MPNNPFPSLILAFLVSLFSVVTLAAEAEKAGAVRPVVQVVGTQAVRVDLNTADAATLERELLGIGTIRAKAIVDYRDANGPFASVDELLEVKGIGNATLEKNRSRLTVN